QQTAAVRLDDLLFSSEYLSPLVNDERRIGLDSPITQLLSNKATVFLFQFLDRHLLPFNLRFLFVSGESNLSGFSVYSHGLFYLIDLLLVIIGLALLWK